MPPIRKLMTSSYIPPASSDGLALLEKRLQDKGINYSKGSFDLGAGDSQFNTPGLLIDQNIRGGKQQTGIFYGDQGELYAFNPANKSYVYPVMDRATLDSGRLHRISAIDRVAQMIQNPMGINGPRKLSSLAFEQGAPGFNPSRVMAQPGIGALYAHGIQLGGQNQEENSALMRMLGPDYHHHADNMAMYREEDYRALPPMGNIGGIDRLMMREKVSKSLRQLTGQASQILSSRSGEALPFGQEPFFAANQVSPNWARTVNVALGVFAPLSEGQGYVTGLKTAVEKSGTFRMPRGTTYNKIIDADGIERNAFEVPGMGTLTDGGFFGRGSGQITQGRSRLGGQSDFRDAFGKSMKSFPTMLVDKMNPVMENGVFTGSVDMTYRGISPEMSWKDASLMKLGLLQTNRAAVPMGADIYARFPDQDRLPAFAMQTLKAELGSTEATQAWFHRLAQSKGFNATWETANFNNGQFSKEALPYVAEAATSRVLNRLEYRQTEDVNLSPMMYDSLQGKRFVAPMDETTAKGIAGANWLGAGRASVPVFDPSSVTPQTNEYGETTYNVSHFNDMVGKYRVASNLRPEFARDQMSLTPSTLNIMSQYNPQLFSSLMNMAPELQKKNRAYNIVSSYRANYSPEARSQVENTFGIQALDLGQVSSIRRSLLAGNSNMTPEELDRGTLDQLKGIYGKSSLSMQTPQGEIVLPHAGALASGLVSDSQGGFLSSFSQKAMSLISGAAAGQDIGEMASETMAAYGRYANQGGVIEKAGSLQFPAFGGIAHGAEGIAANEIIASRAHISKLTGIRDSAQLNDMAQNGSLAAAVLRYPFSNPKEQFTGARMRFYEDMPADFQKKFKNPSRNFYVSNEIQAAEHGDFDIDRTIGIVNRMALGAGNTILGGALRIAPGSEIIKTAKNKIESEYLKFQKGFEERDNFNPRDWAKRFADHNNLFPVDAAGLGAGYRAEEASTGGVGIRYNAILRRMGGTVNRSSQRYGADTAGTVNTSMAILNSASTQGLLDKLSGSDQSLDWVTQISSWGHRVDSSSGSRFTIFPPNGQGGSTEGTDVEGFYQKAFQKFTDIGSGLSQEDYERTGIGRSVAGLIANRKTMNSTQIDTLTNLLNLKHGGKASYEDIFASSGADLGAKNPLSGVSTPYSEWGLSGASAGAETISGALSFHKYKSNSRKGIDQFPDWDTNNLGEGFKQTEGFLQGVENVKKKKGSIRSFIGGIAGASEPMQKFLNQFFPGDESGRSALTDRFITNPKDISSGGTLNPSSWTTGSGVDDALLRVVQMSTNAAERSGVLQELFNQGAFKEFQPYNGAGGGNAASVGTRMEQLFSAGHSYATDVNLPGSTFRRTGTGRIDLLLPHNGSQIIADIKTKNTTTLQSDVLGPKVSSQMGGQLGLYMEGITGFSNINDKNYGDISGGMGAIIFGERPTSPNPTNEEMIGGFETAYNKAQTLFGQSTAPAGFDTSTWEQTRQNSLQLMDTIYQQTGMKVGARSVSAAEAQQLLAERQQNVNNLQGLNPKYRSADMKERAEQILAMHQGRPVPHMPSLGGAGGGAGGGSVGGGGVVGSPDPADPSGGTSAIGGLGAITQMQTINNFKTSMPKLSSGQIADAVVAMQSLGDAAEKLSSPLKAIREEYVKHFDAIKEIVSYGNRASSYGSIGAKESQSLQSDPSYQAFQRYFGASRPGGSIMGGLSQAVQQLQGPAIDAVVQNRLEDENPQGKPGIVSRLFDRAIKGQGLFHAHLAWNMIANPAINAAREYQSYQANNAQSLYSTGAMNYDQMMSGQYGLISRRAATIQQAGLSFGQQVYSAYGSYINAAVSPELVNGIGGAAVGIGMPAAAAAIGATSLTGSVAAGAIAGGVVGLAGIVGYGRSAMNPDDIRAKMNLGRQVMSNTGNFQGALGRELNNNNNASSVAAWISQRAAQGLPTTDKQAADAMHQLMTSGPNQTNANLYNAVTNYLGGTSPILGNNPQQVANFYNAPVSDMMQGAYDVTLQKLGFSQGIGDQQGTQLLNGWMMYHDQMPNDSQIKQLSGAYHANIDPTQLAQSRAAAQGISPYNRDVISRMQEQATTDLYNAQANGKNITLENQKRIYANSMIEQMNSQRRQGGLGTYSEDWFNQWSDQYGTDITNAVTGVGTMAGQTAQQNPDYYNRFGQNISNQAQLAYSRKNFQLGNILSSNMVQGGQLQTTMQSYGMNDTQMDAAQNIFQQFNSPTQVAVRDRFLSGDRQTISQYAQMMNKPQYATMNPDTGASIYYQGVPQKNIDYLRQSSPVTLPSGEVFNPMIGMSDQEASFGTRGWEAAITVAQRKLQGLQYNVQTNQRDIGYNMTTGNLGKVASLMGQFGTGFNQGNGMGYWQLEDASRVLNRAQQTFNYNQDTQQLGIQQQQFALQGSQFYTNYGLQQQKFQYNSNFQRQQMMIDQSHTVQQQGWQTQNLEYSRNQLDVHFAWNMEDYTRNIRYARGMDKRNLMREQGRAVTQYSMEAGQSDKEMQRNQTQIQWEQDDFNRKKQYFEQNTNFQRQELDNQKKFFEQNRELDAQRLRLSQEAHQKQLFWMQEEWKLEDQRISLDRQNYNFQYSQQVLIDSATRQTTLDTQKWSDAINAAGNSLYLVNSKLETFKGIIDALLSIFGVAAPAGGGGSSDDWYGKNIGLPPPSPNGTPGATGGHAGGGPMPAPSLGYARGGFTGYGGVNEAAGIVHKGQWVVPQGGALVSHGSDPMLERVVALLEKSVKIQTQMAQNPTSFTAVLGGQSSKATPISPTQAARARIS